VYDRDAVWGTDSCVPKEACVRWRSRSDETFCRHERCQDRDAAFCQNSLTTCYYYYYYYYYHYILAVVAIANDRKVVKIAARRPRCLTRRRRGVSYISLRQQ